jgi:hypothetical protein
VLELDQRTRKIGHDGLGGAPTFEFCSNLHSPVGRLLIEPPDAEG